MGSSGVWRAGYGGHRGRGTYRSDLVRDFEEDPRGPDADWGEMTPTMTRPNDPGELMSRAQNGDARAFDALVAHYDGRLTALVRSRLGDELARSVDESDILQESLLQAFRSLERFEWRGDCDDSGVVDITDAIFSLGVLFLGGDVPSCDDACDANDDGEIDIADPIAALVMLFLGAAPLPAPGISSCGRDPMGPDADGIDCAESTSCR